ncbi:MAG: DUF2971 domain-containing protein [Cyanobium sp. D14.bin.5]|nr:DUF2971 domain-containing protein [Cyanobium sp. D14.bin.5]
MSLNQQELRDAIRHLVHTPSDVLVCKYMKACTAVRHVLPDKTIRFSPFEEMNDPRETEAQFDCASFIDNSPPKDYFGLQESFRCKFRNQASAFCVTRDEYSNVDQDLMMRRGFGKMRMWAQYGDNHNGACLVFQRDLLESAAVAALGRDRLWCDDIDYNRKMLVAGASAFTIEHEEFRRSPDEYLLHHSRRFQHHLFFRKHDDWIAEKEWRMATIASDGGGLCIRYADSLKYVILGHQVPDEAIFNVKQLFDGPILRLRYSQWKEDSVLNIT